MCWIARNDNPIASMMHLNVNTSSKSQMHPKEQLGGDKCPLVHKNQNRNFFKIINPFNIHTSKRYSCLFMPPLNRFSDKFEILRTLKKALTVRHWKQNLLNRHPTIKRIDH